MVLWVFGYGSLVWKAGFEYNERVVGFIKGYKRVFNQGKTTTTKTLVKNLNPSSSGLWSFDLQGNCGLRT